MGGCIGLTVRFDKNRCYRGSCWTNVLPDGMWAAPFYVDLETSKRHVDQWLSELLANRATDPDLEEMWGAWNMLAPLQYGLIVVDYVSSTLISLQGYSSVDVIYYPTTDAGLFSEKEEKYAALEQAGLLITPSRRPMPTGWKTADIKMPFARVVSADTDAIDADCQKWCEDNFGLSDDERKAWAEWFKDQGE